MIASADARAFRDTMEAIMASDDVDAVIAIYTTIESERTEGILGAISEGVVAGRARDRVGKTVLVCAMASPGIAPLKAGPETLPVYEFPERAARSSSRRR